MGKYMETGEMGFCPACGTLTEVVVLPDDRMQTVVGREVRRSCYKGEPTPQEVLHRAIYQVSCWAALAHDDLEAEDLQELRESLVEITFWLALAGETAGELLNEPVDLLRLAVERLKERHPCQT